jgi:hypothetical protein
MTGGYIEKRIKKSNTKLIILGITGLVITLIVLLFSFGYYRQFFNGPHQLTGADLEQFMTSEYISNKYISVPFDKINDTGVYDSSTDSNGNTTIENRRYIVTIDGLQFVYGADSYDGEKTLTGQLYWLSSAYVDKYAKIASEVVPDSSGDKFLPFIMLKENFMYRGYVGIVLAALFIFLSILLLVNGIRGSLHPDQYHGLKVLEKLGPVEFTMSRIDSEMQFQHQTVGRAHLLTNWLVLENRSGFSAVRYDDIVWAYKQSVANKNFGISFKNTEALIINDRFERVLYLPCKSGQLDSTMALLLPHIPYAYKGFSNELVNVWRSNPQALIRGVEERKLAVTNPPPTSPSDASPAEGIAPENGGQS